MFIWFKISSCNIQIVVLGRVPILNITSEKHSASCIKDLYLVTAYLSVTIQQVSSISKKGYFQSLSLTAI